MSYNAHMRRALDPALPARVRLSNMRHCVVHFAPYGYTATIEHLRQAAGIPADPEDDPESVTRAMRELDEARRIWVAEMEAFAERRRAEKRLGRRRPTTTPPILNCWASPARCPDPDRRPGASLPVAVRRLIDWGNEGVSRDHGCPLCGSADTVDWNDGYARIYRLCDRCGIDRGVRMIEPAPAEPFLPEVLRSLRTIVRRWLRVDD